MTLFFEKATPDDFAWYYALRKRTMTEHFQNAGSNWIEEEQQERHRQDFNPATLRLIMLGTKRIGCINVVRHANELHVNAFCIDPEHQRKGYGTRVLHQILDEPEHRNLPCTLDVLIKNPAYKLYERLGFVKTQGEIPFLTYYVRPASIIHPGLALPVWALAIALLICFFE